MTSTAKKAPAAFVVQCNSWWRQNKQTPRWVTAALFRETRQTNWTVFVRFFLPQSLFMFLFTCWKKNHTFFSQFYGVTVEWETKCSTWVGNENDSQAKRVFYVEFRTFVECAIFKCRIRSELAILYWYGNEQVIEVTFTVRKWKLLKRIKYLFLPTLNCNNRNKSRKVPTINSDVCGLMCDFIRSLTIFIREFYVNYPPMCSAY